MSATEGKYGVIVAEKKEFHPGEPIFLLRATDSLAPQAIDHYGEICEENGCDPEHVKAAFDHARRMRDWQEAHPVLVKSRPD